MFSNNFIVAIKVNGKVLREIQDVVYLPFGTEYTILLKNTSQQKAKVKVSIDGQDATEDVNLIVSGGGSVDLKRFIKNGNTEAGNAFKFIEKTSQIEAFRGNKAEDGLITITYEFERKQKPIDYYDYNKWNTLYRDGGCFGGGITRGLVSNSTTAYTLNASAQSNDGFSFADDASASAGASASLGDGRDALRSRTKSSSSALYSAEIKCSTPLNTSGVTAPGSVVEQKFHVTSGFLTDGVTHTMTLQLKGEVGDAGKLVKEAVVVKKVQRCTMCGTNTKQTAKFCHSCGASVQLV